MRVNKLGNAVGDLCLHGSISGKIDTMVKNKPGSENVGYALRVPRTPVSMKPAYSGSYWNLMQTGAM